MDLGDTKTLTIQSTSSDSLDLRDLKASFWKLYLFRDLLLTPLMVILLDIGIYNALNHFSTVASIHSRFFLMLLVSALHIGFAVLLTFSGIKIIVQDTHHLRNSIAQLNRLLNPSNINDIKELVEKIQNGATLYSFEDKEVSFYLLGSNVLLVSKQKLLFSWINLHKIKSKTLTFNEQWIIGIKAQLNLQYENIVKEIETITLSLHILPNDFEQLYQLSQMLNAPDSLEGEGKIQLDVIDTNQNLQEFWMRYKGEIDTITERNIKAYLALVIRLCDENQMNQQTGAYLIADAIISQSTELRLHLKQIEEIALDLERPVDSATEDGTKEAYSLRWEALSRLIEGLESSK